MRHQEDNIKIISGLVLAQMICRRATLRAFDKNQNDIVLEIMSEIADTIEALSKETEVEKV